MMPSIKLYYNDGRGAAEITRWILAAGGLEYENIRLNTEQWHKIKPNVVFGHLPAL